MPKKILIADDEPGHVKMLAMRLRAHGYEVEAALDGLQALMIALRTKPDLIILDIKMPGQSGYTVFENLRASSHTHLIPVIFLSALPADTVKKRVAQLGAEGFISKPYESEEVLAKIKQILGE